MMSVWLLILHMTLSGARIESTVGVYKTPGYCDMIRIHLLAEKPTRVMECRKVEVAGF